MSHRSGHSGSGRDGGDSRGHAENRARRSGSMRGSYNDTSAQSNIARQFFLRADKDRSGCLDPKEFHSILHQMGFPMDYKEAVEVFVEVDTRQTGKISESEFSQWYAKYVGKYAAGEGGPRDGVGRDEMGPRGRGPGGMDPRGMGPGGMDPRRMGPGGMDPRGMGPGGVGPGGMGPGGMGPGGMGPGGMGPGGMGPGGMGPGGMGPGGMGPGGMGMGGPAGMGGPGMGGPSMGMRGMPMDMGPGGMGMSGPGGMGVGPGGMGMGGHGGMGMGGHGGMGMGGHGMQGGGMGMRGPIVTGMATPGGAMGYGAHQGGMGMGMGGNRGSDMHHHGQFTEERNQRNIAQAVFYEADVSRTNYLDRKEFLNVITRLHIPISTEEAMKWFESVDKSGDGRISMEEWVNFYLDMCNSNRQTFFY